MRHSLPALLLLVSMLTACNRNPAPGSSPSAHELGDLVARGTGKITLNQNIEYKELGKDGFSIESVYSNQLEFAKGILKPFPVGTTRGGSSISVSREGWITLKLQKDVRVIPPTSIKLVEGSLP